MSCPRPLARLASLVLCALLATPLVADEPAADREPIDLPRERAWIEVRTPHFVLYGDASKSKIRRVGRDLERLRSALGQMTTLDLQAPVPLYVFVFRGDASFDPYRHYTARGEPAEIGGAFYRRQYASFMSLNARFGVDTQSLVQHEYVHYFVAYHTPWVPLWFNEGLAELYSTFESFDGYANIGKVDPMHIGEMRKYRPLSLDELIVAGYDSPYYDGTNHRGSFYATSWALTHYLMIGNPKRTSQLFFYLDAQRQMPGRDAFVKAFGATPEQIESEVVDYVRQSIFNFRRVDIRADGAMSDFLVRELPRAEVLARLGEFLAVQRRPIDAEPHLRAALELDESQPRAYAGLGLLAEAAGRFDEATRHYDKAMQMQPDEASLEFLGARARARHGGADDTVVGLLRRAVHHSPNLLDAWELLAWAIPQTDATPLEIIDVFVQVVNRNPERQDIAEALLQLYRQIGEIDAANVLISAYFTPRGIPVPAPPDLPATVPRPVTGGDAAEAAKPDVAFTSTFRLSDEQKKRRLLAERYVVARRWSDALAIFEELHAEVPDHKDLARRVDELRDAVAKDTRRLAHADYSERYGEAKAAYESGRFKVAQKTLEALLVDVAEDGDWRPRVEQFLETARAARRAFGDGEP